MWMSMLRVMIVCLFDDECRRLASPFKEREEPSGVPSWISLQPSGVSFELIV
jgi:hypothetical protein